MSKHNSHAPEITTHINDAEHGKNNIFGKEREPAGNPKIKEGCYSNAEHPSRQEKM